MGLRTLSYNYVSGSVGHINDSTAQLFSTLLEENLGLNLPQIGPLYLFIVFGQRNFGKGKPFFICQMVIGNLIFFLNKIKSTAKKLTANFSIIF